LKFASKIYVKIIKKIIPAGIIFFVVWYVFCLPSVLFDVPYATVVADRNNELLGARIADDNQWRFPLSDTVPDKFKQCIVAFEDRYFYYHWGVNPLAVVRAAVQNFRSGRIESGGSTITMQTIRLARKGKRTWKEKIIEAVWATRLEFRHSKEEILGLYASHAPFGGNVVGLEAASWRYFGHPARQLSWAEAATLAVLPNSPSMIHLSRNRSLLIDKRNRLLFRLKERNIINLSDYELALMEPLPAEPLPLPQIAPHLVNRFYLNDRGKYILSTIDRGLQVYLEDILARWHEEFSRNEIGNIAALVINVETNQVLCYCGNVEFGNRNSGNQVDVIRAPRSTGSILKPLLYCAMLQEGELLPHTLLPDVPLNINGFIPQNFDGMFSGAVPASEALARSLNVPSVNELRTYSVPKFHDFLKKAGLTTLSKSSSHYGLSLILGGAEATLWDVSSAYNNMAKVLLQATHPDSRYAVDCSPFLNMQEEVADSDIRSLYNPGAVWQTFDAIKEVNRPEEIDWKYISSMQTMAWKTGTSHGFRDAWAVGATPKYVVGVWVGNASGGGRPGLVGAKTAAPVMFDIFNALPAGDWFDIPYNELIEAEVCSESGHLKGVFCNAADTILICPGGLKTAPCPYHISVTVTEDEQYRVFEDCAGSSGVKQVSRFVLPPAWEWFYKQNHPSYQSLPPLKPGCGQSGQFRVMQFIYPQRNTRISLPKQMDGSKGRVVFELAHVNPNAVVYWHLDQEYVGMTQTFHQMSLQPAPGARSITAVDNEGNSLSISVIVEE